MCAFPESMRQSWLCPEGPVLKGSASPIPVGFHLFQVMPNLLDPQAHLPFAGAQNSESLQLDSVSPVGARLGSQYILLVSGEEAAMMWVLEVDCSLFLMLHQI